jgi:hypothetical protein
MARDGGSPASFAYNFGSEHSMKSTALALLSALTLAGASAQRLEPITEARVRSLAKEAEAEARGDKTEIVLALDRRVRARFGDFESFPITIVRREDLSIVLSTPFMTYRRALAEYLRMNDPLSRIPWIPAAVVNVGPLQLGAPDIARVVLERNGKPVPPSANLLKPMSFTNGNGDTAVIHAGDIRFPMSALAPGGTVTISAIPKAGDPFVVTLDESQLQTLK